MFNVLSKKLILSLSVLFVSLGVFLVPAVALATKISNLPPPPLRLF